MSNNTPFESNNEEKEELATNAGDNNDNDNNNLDIESGTDFDSFMCKFVKQIESKYDIAFATNDNVLTHKNAYDIIELLRQLRSQKIVGSQGINNIKEDCIEFTNKMLWFLIDILVGMNVALYRGAVIHNNNKDIIINSADCLKQNNSINESPAGENESNDAENEDENEEDKGTPISEVIYFAMNYINDCWHSYFKKDGKIWCIEDCVDTFIKCSELKNVQCTFFHIWRLFTILNDLFLDKLFNDKYPNIKITNANELRAYCMLIIGVESEENLREFIQNLWEKIKCEEKCEGKKEYYGNNYFTI